VTPGRVDPAGPLDPDGTVVVVGASLGGLRTTQALRRDGFRGRLVLVGAEPHLPYDRPPLSKQVLSGKWDEDQIALLKPDSLEDLEVDLRLGTAAASLDVEARRVELDDGSSIEADAVVVATGASPRHLFAEQGVRVLRTIEDSLVLRDAVAAGGRVVVIGAGFIGSEVAATCVELGCPVIVAESLDVPLAAALGTTIGPAVAGLHRRHGVDLRTETSVASVGPGGAGTLSVELTDGGRVEAAAVVAGIGVVPEVGWLADSSLELADGVVCDGTLFAADGVVAVGDVARWPYRGESVRIEHWQMAADMGEAAATSLLAGRREAPRFDPVPYFWSDQYGMKFQVLGRPGPEDEVVVVDGALEDRFVALYRHGQELRAVAALSRPRQLMSYRPLLAARASFDEALSAARR